MLLEPLSRDAFFKGIHRTVQSSFQGTPAGMKWRLECFSGAVFGRNELSGHFFVGSCGR